MLQMFLFYNLNDYLNQKSEFNAKKSEQNGGINQAFVKTIVPLCVLYAIYQSHY